MTIRTLIRSHIRPHMQPASVTDADLDIDAFNLVERMNTRPGETDQGIINTTIKSLKSSGIWAKLAFFHCYGAHASGDDLLNWKNDPRYDGVVTGSVTFTQYRGRTGDGSTGYIGSGYSPASGEQDSHALFVWTRTDLNVVATDIGNGRARIASRQSATLITLSSATTTDTVAVEDSIGLTCISRNNSANYQRFRNGADLGDATRASIAPQSSQIVTCARNNGGTVDSFSTRQILFAGYCKSALTSGEQASLYTILNTHKTAIGA